MPTLSTKMNTLNFTIYKGVPTPRSHKNEIKLDVFPFLHQRLNTMRVDSPVMIWIQIRSRGGGGVPACSPLLGYKNGAIWRDPSVPKYVIINLKINNFK